MADKETSHIMWISIVVAISASILLITKPALAQIGGSIFGTEGKVANVSKSISVDGEKPFDWAPTEKVEEQYGSKATTIAAANLKYYRDPNTTTLSIWSADGKNPAIINAETKTTLKTYIDSTYVTAINFPSETKLVGDMSNLFANTFSVKSLDFTNLDMSEVTNTNYMFNMSQITTIDLSGKDLSNVTNVDSMFAFSNATTINMSNVKFDKAKSLKELFASANASTIILNGMDTSKVTDMSFMFWNMPNIKSIDISTLDTSNVTNFTNMFYYLGTIKEINISNANFSKAEQNKYPVFTESPNLDTLITNNVIKPNIPSNDTSSAYSAIYHTKLTLSQVSSIFPVPK